MRNVLSLYVFSALSIELCIREGCSAFFYYLCFVCVGACVCVCVSVCVCGRLGGWMVACGVYQCTCARVYALCVLFPTCNGIVHVHV